MRAIVAVDENWGIGRRNGLLFRLPKDMRRFREITTGKVIVMGSNTLLSFPGGRPLPDRVNVVLWPGGERREDCVVAGSLDELPAILDRYPSGDVYVVGGAMFYRTMLPYCDEAIVTKVSADGSAEVFFENLDELPGWTLVSEGEETEDAGFRHRLCVYRNASPAPFGPSGKEKKENE